MKTEIEVVKQDSSHLKTMTGSQVNIDWFLERLRQIIEEQLKENETIQVSFIAEEPNIIAEEPNVQK